MFTYCPIHEPIVVYIMFYSLTPKQLGHFLKNVILFRNDVHHKCDISHMKLVQYNECLVSIVDTDDLVL